MLGHPPSHRPNRSGHVAQHLDRESSPHTHPPCAGLFSVGAVQSRFSAGFVPVARVSAICSFTEPSYISSTANAHWVAAGWRGAPQKPSLTLVHLHPGFTTPATLSPNLWNPHPAIIADEAGVAKPSAKQTRHAQPLTLHPVPTSRVHRPDQTVECIDLPLISPVSSLSLAMDPMAAARRGWSDRSLGSSYPKRDVHRQDACKAGYG